MAAGTPLLFADLDGTLIVAPAGVGPRMAGLIDAVQRGGGSFVPVSARPVPNLAAMLHRYIPGSLAIGSGGAVLARLAADGSFTVLHEETLGPAASAELGALWAWPEEGRGVVFMFGASKSGFEVGVASGACELEESALATIAGDRPVRRLEAMASPPDPLLGISLLAPCEPPPLRALSLSRRPPRGWRASVYPEYRVPRWSWLEFLPERASKGEACRRAIGLWRGRDGGPPVTLAAGDASDDVGMFARVGTSYCPADASPEARRAASEVLPAPGGEEFAAALERQLYLFPNKTD